MARWERFGYRLNSSSCPPPGVLDEAQVAAVGEGAKRFPVVATSTAILGTSVTRMGGEFLIGLSREVRQGAGSRPATG